MTAQSGGGRGVADNGKGREVAGLVGAGPSQVGTVGAMRARDVARPREKDVVRAERTVVLRRQRDESSPAS